jgi:hypothetical protein
MVRPARSHGVLAFALLAAGCGGASQPPVQQDAADPAIADAALTGGGVASAAMPTPERSAEEVAKARGEALALVGGKLPATPEPVPGTRVESETVATTAALALKGGPSVGCVNRLGYSFEWAARMPPDLPIYPRAAVHEAAGVEGEGCRLRAINFRTPVPLADVASFYVTRAAIAGYRTGHTAGGDMRTITAGKGTARVYVLIRPGPDSLTEVDLVTSDG